MEQLFYFMINPMNVRPIIIVGCQRSGTTLLRALLGGHPDLVAHPTEPQFIIELYRRFGMKAVDVETAVSYLITHPYLPSTLNEKKLRQAFSDKTTLTLPQFIQLYLHCWAGDRLQSKRPVLKEPAFIFHLDLVEALFPQATVIHIIRDPRANVASQRARWPHLSTLACAMLWRDALRAAHSWSQTTQLSYVEVRYEQLLQNTTESLKTICAALEIPYRASMETFEQTMFVFAPGAEPQSHTYTAVDASKLHRWREHLAPQEIKLIEQSCQREMIQWQYKPSDTALPLLPYQWWKAGQYLRLYLKKLGKTVKTGLRQVGWRMGINKK
jgi:LPS sulfotransferase NodH